MDAGLLESREAPAASGARFECHEAISNALVSTPAAPTDSAAAVFVSWGETVPER
jgi:hypothetical protein